MCLQETEPFGNGVTGWMDYALPLFGQTTHALHNGCVLCGRLLHHQTRESRRPCTSVVRCVMKTPSTQHTLTRRRKNCFLSESRYNGAENVFERRRQCARVRNAPNSVHKRYDKEIALMLKLVSSSTSCQTVLDASRNTKHTHKHTHLRIETTNRWCDGS